MFRDRVFDFLIKKEKITAEIAEGMRSWPHSGFAVDFQRKIEADDRKGLEGLLTYMDRPPVSLGRLTYRPEEGLVHYQATKLHPRLGIDHQLLASVEFLALLVGHVCLRYEVTIRSYGALSTTFRKRVGWVEVPPLKEPPATALLRHRSLTEITTSGTGRSAVRLSGNVQDVQRSCLASAQAGRALAHSSKYFPASP